MHTLWRGATLYGVKGSNSQVCPGLVHKDGHAILYARMFLLQGRTNDNRQVITHY